MKLLYSALLPLVLGLGSTATAQSDEAGGTDGAAKSRNVVYVQLAGGLTEVMTDENGKVTKTPLSPAEVTKRRKAGAFRGMSGRNVCTAMAYCKPRRLAPGQSGEVFVVVTLIGKAVALPGSQIRLALDNIAELSFDSPVLEPAELGTLEGKFKGTPVYDDYLQFRVPVTVSPEARSPAKIDVLGTLSTELTNGETGVKLGSYIVEVRGKLEVGAPLPDQSVAARAGGAKNKKTKNHAKSKGPRKSKKPVGVPRKSGDGSARPGSGTGGVLADPAGSVHAPGGADEVDGMASEGDLGDDAPNFLAWSLGGVVLLLLVLLLLARRK